MSSKSKPATREEAFEMIELAIDELDLLTRAFSVIKEACDQMPDQQQADKMQQMNSIHLH